MTREIENIDILVDQVRKIFKKESGDLSYIHGYSLCYDVVIRNGGEVLYENTKRTLNDHIFNFVQPLIRTELCHNRLDILNNNWQDLLVCVKKMQDLLMILDSHYAERKNLLKMYDMGINCFRQLVIHNDTISKPYQNVLLDMITSERNGNTIDRSAIKIAIDLLIYIAKEDKPYFEYEELFEKPFLENTGLYYKREVQEWLKLENGAEYLKNVERKLSEERERASRYLNERTESKLMDLVEQILIGDNLVKIFNLDYSVDWMIQARQLNNLKQLYNWSNKYSLTEAFFESIHVGFIVKCTSIINQINPISISPNEKSKIIQDLIDLQTDFMNTAEDCFDKDPRIIEIVKQSFQSVMNTNQQNSEYLAFYVHDKMRVYEKNTSDIKIEEELNQFIELFKLITEKDLFETHFRVFLAKRLISRKANLDTENKFILKLQHECGLDYTKKLKQMTQEITYNEDCIQEFCNSNRSDQKIEFSLYVLNSFVWPKFFSHSDSIILPQTMEDIYSAYSKYYQIKQNSRKLTLHVNIGNVYINAQYYKSVSNDNKEKLEKRCYVFEATTLQAIVLMNFNTSELTFIELQNKTNLSDDVLILILETLRANKILLCNSSKNVKDRTYRVNEKFNFRRRNYKIKSKKNNNDQVEEKENNERIVKEIDRDRGYEIDAAVVRIMKARRALKKNELQIEIINMVKGRFTPTIELIKMRLKSLVDREFIKYDQSDSENIIYLE